jgi:tRNA G18 (ribose-2'-O)-methylase SpoU
MRKLTNEELERLTPEEYKKVEKSPIIIILDDIRSLNNIGSVFRTSDAFRVEHIYLCGITATPPHRDIHKTALGATESVPWTYAEDTAGLIRNLKEKGVKTFALEQADKSTSLEQFAPGNIETIALVFGNEVKGVKEDVIKVVDGVIEIPQFGTKHSFNIAVSAGIVIWDIYWKMNEVYAPRKNK